MRTTTRHARYFLLLRKYYCSQIKHYVTSVYKPEFLLFSEPKDDSFPWKISLADVSCYTLELPRLSTATDVMGQEKAGISAGLKSKLKISGSPKANRKTVLELVTTTITISVVTKALQYKTISRNDLKKAHTISEEDRVNYLLLL